MSLTLNPIVSTGTLTPPDITKLTTGKLDGTGAFDVLMQTVKLYLVDEYDNNRITQDEYSAVFLGALNGTLEQAIQFLLSHQQEEKVLAEIGLIRQKTVTELAQTDDLIVDGLGFNDGTDVAGVVAKQKQLLDQQIAESVEKVKTFKAESDLVGQKIVTELANTDSNLSGIASAGYGFNNDYIAIEGLMKAQIDKVSAEVDYVEQQVVTEVAQVNDALPATGYGKHTSATLTGLIKAQKDKIAREMVLIGQKAITEQAQTDDDIDTSIGLNTTSAVEGVIKEQILIAKQQVLESIQKVETAKAEVTLMQQKVVTELAQTDDDLTAASLYGLNDSYTSGVEGLIAAQRDKLEAEKDFAQQRTVTEVGNVNNSLPSVGYGKHTSTTPGGLLDAQIKKSGAEVDLLKQKTMSELAQTEESMPASYGVGAGGAVAGVIGKQKILFAKQTDGFDRDAEAKMAKVMGDVFTSGLASDSGQGYANSYFDNVNTGHVISKAMEGINATTTASSKSGTLSYTGQPSNAETVTLGTKTYVFQTTLTDVDGNVKIGATLTESIDNLIAAMKLDAGAGTKYAASTTAHPNAALLAYQHVSDTMVVTQSTGTGLASTETITNANWGAPTLA
jgi:hypothetical protein